VRIFGFLQVRNESSSGHLARFLEINGPLFDKLFAIDDASSDDTVSKLKHFGANVIENSESNFKNESLNKAALLEKIGEIASPGDAILWLDADEVLYSSRSELTNLISESFEAGYDSISLNHLNLWRSEGFYRTDDQYNSLRPVRIWKFSSSLTFSKALGLHGQTHPSGLQATVHSDRFPVVHFGFAELGAILQKYGHYFLHWQSGYALDRLVNEVGMELQSLNSYPHQLGDRFVAKEFAQPEAISPFEWKQLAEKSRLDSLESVEPQVTIVCLIFKSLVWLEFSYGEALKLAKEFKRGEAQILFVANDASPEVIQFLEANRIPFIEGSGKKHSDEWYINSVYRAYNEGVRHSSTPWVYLINSDMAFAQGALSRSFSFRHKDRLVATRLIERGVLSTGLHGVERDFGATPRKFRRGDFSRFSSSIRESRVENGGLYMPLLASRDTLLKAGGFPEGNVRETQLPRYMNDEAWEAAAQGESCIPGDRAFFEKFKNAGVEHITIFDSLAYHFQEGELRSKADSRVASGFAVMNDLVVGVNREEVLWTRLVKHFGLTEGRGIIHTGMPQSKLAHFLNPGKLWILGWNASRKHPYRLMLANGTFQLPSRFAKLNLVLVQDRVQSLVWKVLQRISMHFADRIASNDLELVSQVRRSNPIWIQIDTALPEPENHTASFAIASNKPQTLNGVFVGAFNRTKGYSLLVDLVSNEPDVHWTLSSKISGDNPTELEGLENVTVLNALSHDQIAWQLQESDFLVSTSPWETQHLASLEAVSLDKPVYITPTGFLGFGANGQRQYGWVSTESEFIENFQHFKNSITDFAPRKWLDSQKSIGEKDFYVQIEELLQRTFEVQKEPAKSVIFAGRVISFALNTWRTILRTRILPAAFKVLRTLGLRRPD
jgi:hypothetical protein